MHKPRIDNPCPMMLSRMSRSGPNFSCCSCQKEIVDFRGKLNTEIKCLITSSTCGVFDSDQLVEQKERSYYYKSIFFTVTVLSFLGFNVSPINAQITNEVDTVMVDSTNVTSNDQPHSTIDSVATAEKKNIKKERRGIFRRKKKKFKVIGTPAF